MQEPIPSAKRPSGWRRAKLVAGTLALTMGAFGAAAVTAAPAWAGVTTNTYPIGAPSGAVTSVAETPTSATQNVANTFTLAFVATAALSYSAPSTITIGDSSTSPADNGVTTTVVNAEVIDETEATCFVSDATVDNVAYGLEIQLATAAPLDTCSIAAGDHVEIIFSATPPATGTFYFVMTTSGNATKADSNAFTVVSVPPNLSVSSVAFGANATDTITNIGASNATGGSWATLTADATTLVITSQSNPDPIDWYTGGAPGYTVTYTPSGGTATADEVTAAVAAAGVVTLTLNSGIPEDSLVTVTGIGTNPAAASTDHVTIEPEGEAPLVVVGPTETSGTVTFGTSPYDVTVSPSPSLASASATYIVSFNATTKEPVGDNICLNEDNTTWTGVSGALVNDVTAGWDFVAPAVPLPIGAACGNAANSAVFTLPAGDAISAGDHLVITIGGVGNPTTAATYSDFAVSTTADPVEADASPYAITVSSTVGVSVTTTPATTGSIATYTISGLIAGAGGLAADADITLDASPAGTVFPNAAGDISVTDTTTPSGSGTVSDIVAGGGTDDIEFEVPNAINAGDLLTFTITDVVNPGSANTYSIAITGNVGGPAYIAPLFPDATRSFPSGAIVFFAGTAYVFAGGHAFGISSPTVLAALSAVDPAVYVTAPAGTAVPTAAPLVGTTLIINGTIYVVGTDGELHGFATPAQFLGDGYDPADVISVPNFGGLTVGATAGSVGAGANALATVSNGAIVDSSGTFWVFAGGKAFGIPSIAVLLVIEAEDLAVPLVGTVASSLTSATIATGTVVTLGPAVYIASAGSLFEFKSPSQLDADGVGGTPSIVVPNAGGLQEITSYTGA